jgi:hypothetical protein
MCGRFVLRTLVSQSALGHAQIRRASHVEPAMPYGQTVFEPQGETRRWKT